MSTNQTTSQEIATNTSNIHLTANTVRVQLDSSLQGHLKALTELTTGIERANHHSQLLQIAIDTKRPPRGLIPKVLKYQKHQAHSLLSGKTHYKKQD